MGRFPWAEVVLFEVLSIAVLYPTRHRAHRVVVLSAMVYVATQIYQTPEVADPIVATYTVGCTIGTRFIFMTYLFFAEGSFPDNRRRVRDEVHAKADEGSSDGLPSNFPLGKKLRWMLDLAYSPRMVGWIQEPRDSIPPHPSPSRRTFFGNTFLRFVRNAIITDFLQSVLALSPAFDNRLHDPSDGPETYLAAIPLLRRVPYILSLTIGMGASTSAIQDAVALVCVGFCGSSPTLWPDAWGSWRDAYTLRRLWGRTWHQRFRPMIVGLGKLVANKFLKFPRGTNRSSYTQLYIAFFLSALIHFSGDFMFEKRLVYRSFKFFLLQAVAITVEDFVIYSAKRVLHWRGIELKLGKADESWAEAVLRVIGYCWVTLWFCFTVPMILDELNTFGVSSADRGTMTQFLLDTWKQWA